MTIQLDLDQQRTVKHVCYKINDLTDETTLELDSHADTCVLGRDALIFLDFDQLQLLKDMTLKLMLPLVVRLPMMTLWLVRSITSWLTKPYLSHISTTASFAQCNVEGNDVTINKTPKSLTRNLTDHMHVSTVKEPLH